MWAGKLLWLLVLVLRRMLEAVRCLASGSELVVEVNWCIERLREAWLLLSLAKLSGSRLKGRCSLSRKVLGRLLRCWCLLFRCGKWRCKLRSEARTLLELAKLVSE